MKIFPFFIPFQGCRYQCVYCNQKAITKQENTDWNKMIEKLRNIIAPDIDEIAFYGGTFSNLPKKLQEKLLSQHSQKIWYRFSTRPDCLNNELLTFYKQNNVRTIELGVQSFSDSVLQAANRKYSSQQAIDICSLIQDYGFQLGIQLMPGLPAFDEQSLEETIQKTVSIQPDFVRIYPTIVLKETELETWYRNHQYQPLSLHQAIEICGTMKNRFQEHNIKISKIGLHSDIAKNEIVAGPYHPSFGELVKANSLVQKIKAAQTTDKVLVLSTKDVSLFKGFQHQYLNRLKAGFNVEKIAVFLDEKLASEAFYFLPKNRSEDWCLW